MKKLPDEYWRLMASWTQARGYVIMADFHERKIGEKFIEARAWDQVYELPQPFVIVGRASREEFAAQAKAAGFSIGPEEIRESYFYRMVTE